MLIQAQGLCKSYRRGSESVEALHGVDLQVKPGEFVVVLGPSGSGKSTLLNLLGGLDRPTAGTLQVGQFALNALSEAALDRYRRGSVGFVFQFNNLIPTLNARDNVALPLLADGGSWQEGRRAADRLLAELGLDHRRDHLPAELSGGEQQRVALARAVVGQPALVLADEPTGDLDQLSAQGVLDLMLALNGELGSTFVVATHNVAIAELAHTVVRLSDGRAAPAHSKDPP